MTPRPKAPTPKQEHRWRIVRITHTPAKFVGHVYAPDEDAALRRAVEQFGIRSRGAIVLALREN